MKIKTKRVAALTIAMLMPFLVSCKKNDNDIVLTDSDITYGLELEETEPTTEEVFEEFEGYMTESIYSGDLELDKYEKVNVIEDNTDSYLIQTKDYNEGYINKYEVEMLPDTYIEVDISDQNLKLYRYNEEIIDTDVVTGKNSTPTSLGYYEISYKEEDVTLEGSNSDGTDYSSHVNYWMPFNGGEGFHDATWRNDFGGDIYENDGSHGCVNMPYDEAKELYNNVESGTKVLIHK